MPDKTQAASKVPGRSGYSGNSYRYALEPFRAGDSECEVRAESPCRRQRSGEMPGGKAPER